MKSQYQARVQINKLSIRVSGFSDTLSIMFHTLNQMGGVVGGINQAIRDLIPELMSDVNMFFTLLVTPIHAGSESGCTEFKRGLSITTPEDDTRVQSYKVRQFCCEDGIAGENKCYRKGREDIQVGTASRCHEKSLTNLHRTCAHIVKDDPPSRGKDIPMIPLTPSLPTITGEVETLLKQVASLEEKFVTLEQQSISLTADKETLTIQVLTIQTRVDAVIAKDIDTRKEDRQSSTEQHEDVQESGQHVEVRSQRGDILCQFTDKNFKQQLRFDPSTRRFTTQVTDLKSQLDKCVREWDRN